MGLYQCVAHALGIGSVTRPPILARMPDHPRAHRIRFDVAIASKTIGVAIDQRRFESTLPKRTRPLVLPIGGLNIITAEIPHDQRNPISRLRGNQDVNMVGHQDKSVHGAKMSLAGFEQQGQIQAIVGFFEETGLAIISTLDNMLRNSRYIQARRSRHFCGTKFMELQPALFAAIEIWLIAEFGVRKWIRPL